MTTVERLRNFRTPKQNFQIPFFFLQNISHISRSEPPIEPL